MPDMDVGMTVGLIKALGSPDPAVIEGAVSDWLDDHPEATTTVEDGAISYAKLDSSLKGTVDDVGDLKTQMSDKADRVLKSASGAIVTFSDGTAGLPLKAVDAAIALSQSGTGDPSPTNVRTISGYTGCTVNHSGADTTNPTAHAFDWQGAAGTVYGGELDVVHGILTVTHAIVDMGDLTWTGSNGTFFTVSIKDEIKTGQAKNSIVCEKYKTASLPGTANVPDFGIGQNSYQNLTTNVVVAKDSNYSDATTFTSAVSGVHFVYELKTSVTYMLTAADIIVLAGENNLWSTIGNIYVEYQVATKDYVDGVAAGLVEYADADVAAGVNELGNTLNGCFRYPLEYSLVEDKGINYTNGGSATTTKWDSTGAVFVNGYDYIIYSRIKVPDSETTFGMSFHQSSGLYISGISGLTSQQKDGYQLSVAQIPQGTSFCKFTISKTAPGFCVFGVHGISEIKNRVGTLESNVSTIDDEVDSIETDVALLQSGLPQGLSGKVNKPSTNGTSGQLLRTNGDGTTDWVDAGLPTDAQTEAAISDWLNDHPDATSTVEDGSLTEAKFSNALKLSAINSFITPEMYGAVGDGVTDDTSALNDAIDAAVTNGMILYLQNEYLVTSPIVIENNITIQRAIDSVIVYDGTQNTGVYAITIKPASGSTTNLEVNVDISVKNASQQFYGASGILIQNAYRSYIKASARFFNTGLHLQADGTGCVYNTVYPTFIQNCLIGILLDTSDDPDGWVNQNTFIGGSVALTSTAYQSLDEGDYFHDLIVGSNNNHPANNNLFVGTSFENNSNSDDRSRNAITINGEYNYLIGCRYEGITSLGVTGRYSFVVGGYKFNYALDTSCATSSIIPIAVTTSNRPTQNRYDGYMVFDTTLRKPIWSVGSNWVDATGAYV